MSEKVCSWQTRSGEIYELRCEGNKSYFSLWKFNFTTSEYELFDGNETEILGARIVAMLETYKL